MRSRCGRGCARTDRADPEVMLIITGKTVDYVYLAAVVIGGILVNCGVLMMLDILAMRILGGVTVVLGVLLVSVTTVALHEEPDTSSTSSGRSAESLELRTPIVDGLTVRVGPGTQYESATAIWQVNRGDKLRVVEDSLGWIRFRVRYFDPDWSGWVAKEYTTVWDTYQEIKRIDRLSGQQRRAVSGN